MITMYSSARLGPTWIIINDCQVSTISSCSTWTTTEECMTKVQLIHLIPIDSTMNDIYYYWYHNRKFILQLKVKSSQPKVNKQ